MPLDSSTPAVGTQRRFVRLPVVSDEDGDDDDDDDDDDVFVDEDLESELAAAFSSAVAPEPPDRSSSPTTGSPLLDAHSSTALATRVDADDRRDEEDDSGETLLAEPPESDVRSVAASSIFPVKRTFLELQTAEAS